MSGKIDRLIERKKNDCLHFFTPLSLFYARLQKPAGNEELLAAIKKGPQTLGVITAAHCCCHKTQLAHWS